MGVIGPPIIKFFQVGPVVQDLQLENNRGETRIRF